MARVMDSTMGDLCRLLIFFVLGSSRIGALLHCPKWCRGPTKLSSQLQAKHTWLSFLPRRRTSSTFLPGLSQDLHLMTDVPNPFVASRRTCSLAKVEAADAIDNDLFPLDELGARVRIGRDAQGVSAGESISNDDPRNALTYGEFPLASFDVLIDRAVEEIEAREGRTTRDRNIVDVGSGCGRLVIHAALTLGSSSEGGYNIHGIEISSPLQDYAVATLQRGISEGYFETGERRGDESDCGSATVHLHLGPAADMAHIFADADIVFAYSTVWPVCGFSVELGAMIVSSQWSIMLSQACRSGCIVVTTDRVLDPQVGWELVDRIDVENPDLLGSTGFIQVLRK